MARGVLGRSSGKEKILLFCNGNPEDYRFAKKLWRMCRREFPGKTVLLGKRP